MSSLATTAQAKRLFSKQFFLRLEARLKSGRGTGGNVDWMRRSRVVHYQLTERCGEICSSWVI